MAIIGGFLGGGVEMVPAGHSQLIMQWTTDDGLNISGASFIIDGTQTIFANSSGYAEAIVEAGTHEITVKHSGTYSGSTSRTIQCESTQSYYAYFYGTSKGAAILILNNLLEGFDYQVKSQTGAIVASGKWSGTQSISLPEGTYYLHVLRYGLEAIKEIQVMDETTVDTSDLFYTLQLPKVPGNLIKFTTTEGSFNLPSGTVIIPSVGIIKATLSCEGSLSGVVSGPIVTLSPSEVTIDTSQSTPVSILAIPSIFLITQSGTLTSSVNVPIHALLIGGGGDVAGTQSGGGGSGRITDFKGELPAGNTTITIGAGGNNGGNGGITSLGSLASASGGDYGKYYNAGRNGGNGGAGGGGGYYVGSSYGSGSPGGNGQFGGGGGAGRPYSTTSNVQGRGGTKGTYGGDGGYSAGSGS